MRHFIKVFAAASIALAATAAPMPTLPAAAQTADDSLQPDNVKNLRYDYVSAEQHLESYDIVRAAMEPVYKGTFADRRNKNQSNPVIGVAQYDLNNDGVPEIISIPIEEDDQGQTFCDNSLCPNYIIDVSGDKPRVLGVLNAYAVDRGDNVKNGYWTLKAFTGQNDPKTFGSFDTYVYDREKGRYQNTARPAPKKPSP